MPKKVDTQFTGEMQDELFFLEDHSWWFQYRAKLLAEVAELFFCKDCLTYDVGGGNGFTTRYLEKLGYNMALLEPTEEACVNGKKRGLKKVVCGTIDDLKESVEQISLLDVLEHIEDDEAFLHNLHRHLSAEGRLLIAVPAFKVLWSSEDDAAGHFRRYRLRELRCKVQSAGFDVLLASYFYQFLFLPILLVRVLFEKIGILRRYDMRDEKERRKINQQQFEERGYLVTKVLELLISREIRKIKSGVGLSFGSSIVLVAKKK